MDDLESDGLLVHLYNESFIFVNQSLPEYDKINVLLHEYAHHNNLHHNSSLKQVATYHYRIEHEAETDRIIDFMQLVNAEYPIDDNFNYIDYMKKALIPPQYESLVKETAIKLYKENKRGQ